MDTRLCTGFALAASYWHDHDEPQAEPPAELLAELRAEEAAVRAALVARCARPYRLPQRERR